MLGSILTHWRTLGIVFGSLCASTLFAIGHHLFYQSLADTPVSTANDFAIGPWAGMSSQKFNVAVGNTFASLFRMFLSIAVTTAYVQMVWKVLKAESTELDVVDALSGILANPLGFFSLGAWRRSFLLLAFAGPIWLLSIPPIITPATLTIETISRESYDLANVSTVDFNSLNFASVVSNSQGACGYFYTGPQFEVMKVVTAAAGQSAVLPISAPGNQPNASYVQQFAGPALQCKDVTEPLRGQIISNVNISSWNATTSYGYLAWVPTTTKVLPFELVSVSDRYDQWQLQSVPLGPTAGPLSIFVFTSPNMRNPYGYGMDPEYDYYGNATIIKCQLMNATYSSSFNWTNGIRSLDAIVANSAEAVLYRDAVDCAGFLYTQDIYTADNYTGPAPGNISRPLSDFNNTIVRNFAYQSVMQAFGNILKGSINYPHYPNGLVVTTNVMDTVLGATRELSLLRNNTSDEARSLASLGPQVWPGVSVEMQLNNTSDLRTTLEKMFQNTTMSLISSPLLQSVISLRPDSATPYFPPPVNVTTITYQNFYAYSAALLWLAYGTAILIATITAVMGCVSIFSSGISYSSSFSTILRTTSHAFVSTKISKDDAVGQDPLPEHLAEATIAFDNDDQRVGGLGFGEVVVVKGVHERLLIQDDNECR
ncbi:hypothetical protein E4T45_04020 [Aureobasidium sp. EXF-8846]|nr:hypothetical protein E4T45_04020 [Aureobasidium sp. EXF-8846]